MLYWFWLFFCFFIISFFRGAEGKIFHILIDNIEVKILDIRENNTYSLSGLADVVIKVKDGKVMIEESDCKDHLCICQGVISSIHEK